MRYTDGADSYRISERSLGFRWFFGSLLLTQFRKSRIGDQRQVIYVFDEPASNLHSSAQKKLLETFGQLARQSPVLYSTHSHHLINPDWLENAYVVKNCGLSYDAADYDYSSRALTTLVEVERYREFVAKHPRQTTYYQPILDVLDDQPSHLEMVPKLLLVEGKNDYYTLRMMQCQKEMPAKLALIKVTPGNGAGGLDPLIKLYTGWGALFHIFLDSDKAGEKEKKRYEKEYGAIVLGRVDLIGGLVAGHAGAMESMFSVVDKQAIAKATGQTGTPNKELFNRCVQECCARKLQLSLEKTTLDRFEKLLTALDAKL